MTGLRNIDQLHSSTFFITAVVCYAVFVDQLFFAFILPVLPYSLPQRNGVADSKVQYWTTILIVVFGVACLIACPVTGWWTDRHASRRVPFLAGLAVLLASTLLMWLAKPISLQVVSRVGQGVADAMLYIVGMTIILDTVSNKHIAEYMGYVAIALNVGTFAGPLLGGVVFDLAGYNAVWWMMIGFVLVDALLRFLMLEKVGIRQVEDSPGKLPPDSGQELAAMTENKLATPDGTWATPQDKDPTRREFAVQVGKSDSFDGIVSVENMPAILTLLKSARMDVALYGICVQSMIFSGFETVLSLYVQQIWQYNSLGAGLIFLPLTIPAFFAPVLGRLIDRTTPRWALVFGFLGLCPVLVVTQYVQGDDMGRKILMCVLLVLIGVGITVALNPLMAEISNVVEDLEREQPWRYRKAGAVGGGAYAQAYALFAMAWSAGNIAGPLMCGLIKDKAGWRTMCWTLGLLSGTTAVPCFIWSGEGWNGWPVNRRGGASRTGEAADS